MRACRNDLCPFQSGCEPKVVLRDARASSGRVLCGAFRASQSLLFACARVSDDSAHPSARDTPSPKAAGPHRPDRGPRAWPSGVLSPRHQRANIGRRGTWPLPGAAPAMVLSFSQTDGGSCDEDVSSPRKMARPVQRCLRSARCPSKGAEIVSARARQRENNEVAPHRPQIPRWGLMGAADL